MLTQTENTLTSSPTKMWGNRCGHRKDAFRPYERPRLRPNGLPYKELPPLIKEAVRKSELFYWLADKLLLKLKDVNGSTAKQRSERREALARVLQVLFSYCDQTTFHVGTAYTKKNKTGINYLRTGRIAELLDCNVKQVQRALKDLEKAAYIEIKRKVINKHNNLYQANEIVMRRHCFLDLGISNPFIERSRGMKYKSDAKHGRVNPILKAIARSIPPKTPTTLHTLSPEMQQKAGSATSAAQCMGLLRALRRGAP